MTDAPLRGTFDQAADRYDEARPGYPEQLFDDLIEISATPPGCYILEIGPGTGKATLPLARRGYHILGIELGEQLAAKLRENVAALPNVEVQVGPFETHPIEPSAFDLVMAATAFHWLEQPAGYRQSYHALKPGGSLAIFRHEHVWTPASGSFFNDTQEFYERHMPGTPPGFRLPTPDEVLDSVEEIEASGLFGPVEVRRYMWDETYDAESYIALLDTYSGHLRLNAPSRRALYEDIAGLIDDKFGGQITKTYLVILHVARRR